MNVGFAGPDGPHDLVRAVLARRRGRIGDHEVAPLVDFVLDPAGSPLVTYLGHASPDRRNLT
ncbi:hypothetical protein [Actinopolymorpha pittospori]